MLAAKIENWFWIVIGSLGSPFRLVWPAARSKDDVIKSTDQVQTKFRRQKANVRK